MSHTPPIFIKHGKNTSAFFTMEKPTNLVIFVHGFNGSATGTWDEFPSLIRKNNDFSNSDLYFYGYESLKGQVNNNSLIFYTFLKTVCENSPNKFGFTRAYISKDFTYERIIIVAHSLGAIIVRRALLNGKLEKKDWLKKCRMVLFAPAHNGSRIQNVMLEVLPTIGKIFAGLGLIKFPVLDDLRPDSQTIKKLIEDTDSYITKDDYDFTVAHTVVWAQNENVVYNAQFCQDPLPCLINKQSHISICKPKSGSYIDPYDIVKQSL